MCTSCLLGQNCSTQGSLGSSLPSTFQYCAERRLTPHFSFVFLCPVSRGYSVICNRTLISSSGGEWKATARAVLFWELLGALLSENHGEYHTVGAGIFVQDPVASGNNIVSSLWVLQIVFFFLIVFFVLYSGAFPCGFYVHLWFWLTLPIYNLYLSSVPQIPFLVKPFCPWYSSFSYHMEKHCFSKMRGNEVIQFVVGMIEKTEVEIRI